LFLAKQATDKSENLQANSAELTDETLAKLKIENLFLLNELACLRKNSPSDRIAAEKAKIEKELEKAKGKMAVLVIEKQDLEKAKGEMAVLVIEKQDLEKQCEVNLARIAELVSLKETAESKIRDLEDQMANNQSSLTGELIVLSVRFTLKILLNFSKL